MTQHPWRRQLPQKPGPEALRNMAERNRREIEVLQHAITYVRKTALIGTLRTIRTLEVEARKWEAEAVKREREEQGAATPFSPEMSKDIKDLAPPVRK